MQGATAAASYAGLGVDERHHVYEQPTPAEWHMCSIFQELEKVGGHDDGGQAVIMFVWFGSRHV